MAQQVITETNFSKLVSLNKGKVRDMYGIPGHDDKLLIVASDRISAYDVVMSEGIPGKGENLTQMSLFWFGLLGEIVDNHLITADVNEYPEACQPYADVLRGRSMLVKKAKPLPIECIVRGYISGSFWKAYQKAPVSNCREHRFKNVLGHHGIPADMQESEKFHRPLFTPSTKAEIGGHDENISLEQTSEIIGAERTQEIAEICLNLYSTAADYARSRGIIIADTKFELGEVDGRLILIDEVLTPDSSRFWPFTEYRLGKSQPSFDKQPLRDYLANLEGWDKNPPPPPLPKEIIMATRENYEEARMRLIVS